MGNGSSKRNSNQQTQSLPPRTPSISAAASLSLARFPSISQQQPSSIPESVQLANDPSKTPSDPILIWPRLTSPPSNGNLHGSYSSTNMPGAPLVKDATASGKTPHGAVYGSSPMPRVGSFPDRIASNTSDQYTIGSANGPSPNSPYLNALSNLNLNIDDMIQRLLEAGYSGRVTKSICLKNSEITAICQVAREIFLSQPSLLELTPPVKIAGDIHGQYTDLLRLFEMCGYPPASNYLFLGDYVDRGKQSLETMLLLLCYKIKFPENFFLLRGNHECANVTRVYGFYDECKRRANVKMWKTFVSVFNTLPIAAIVANKIFCVHGGLSPALNHMDDIRRIPRPQEIPDYGLLNDLLWSDPSETAIEWEDNERGVSYCFGKRVVNQFLQKHDLDLVCRAHMVVEDGYEFFGDRQLVTLFSAPNYCGEFDNYGAIMGVGEELMCSFELLKPMEGQFGASPASPKAAPIPTIQEIVTANGAMAPPKLSSGVYARRDSPPVITRETFQAPITSVHAHTR